MTDYEMQELARLERNNYQRAWRARNKDKVKQTNAQYWVRRAKKAVAEKEAADADNREDRA